MPRPPIAFDNVDGKNSPRFGARVHNTGHHFGHSAEQRKPRKFFPRDLAAEGVLLPPSFYQPLPMARQAPSTTNAAAIVAAAAAANANMAAAIPPATAGPTTGAAAASAAAASARSSRPMSAQHRMAPVLPDAPPSSPQRPQSARAATASPSLGGGAAPSQRVRLAQQQEAWAEAWATEEAWAAAEAELKLQAQAELEEEEEEAHAYERALGARPPANLPIRKARAAPSAEPPSVPAAHDPPPVAHPEPSMLSTPDELIALLRRSPLLALEPRASLEAVLALAERRHVKRYAHSSVSLGSLAILIEGELLRLDEGGGTAAAAPSATAAADEAARRPPLRRPGSTASAPAPAASSSSSGADDGSSSALRVSLAGGPAADPPAGLVTVGEVLHEEALVHLYGGERSLVSPFEAATPATLLVLHAAEIARLRREGHLLRASAAAQLSVCSRHLRRLAFFRALSDETVAKVAVLLQLRVCAKGEPAVSPHAPDSLVLVAQGSVEMPAVDPAVGSGRGGRSGSGGGARGGEEKPRPPMAIRWDSARSWCNERPLIESGKVIVLDAVNVDAAAADPSEPPAAAAPVVPLHRLPVALEPSTLLLVPSESFLDLRIALPTFAAVAGSSTLLSMREGLMTSAAVPKRVPKRDESLVTDAQRSSEERSATAISRWEILVFKLLPDSSFQSKATFSLCVADYAQPRRSRRKEEQPPPPPPPMLPQSSASYRSFAAKEAAAWRTTSRTLSTAQPVVLELSSV